MSYQVFQQLCEQNGVTPSQVSKATGVATATLTSWKKGLYVPKHEKMKKIADYFNVSERYLTTGQDTEKESVDGNKYYFSDKTAAVAQEVFETPELQILFDAARDSKPEDLQMAADLLKRLKATNPNG